MKENILHFKCDHCDEIFSYPEDGVVAKGIHAIHGSWMNEEKLLQQNPPEINSFQTVSIGGKLKIDLNKEFWIYFEEPLSSLNGLDTIEGINSIRFCKCSLIEIESSNEKSATLTVSITEIFSVEELSLKKGFENEMPERWETFLEQSFDRIQILAIENYLLLIINHQSDLGMTMLIKKGIDESKILMVHDWDFHTNAFYGTNIKIKNADLEKLQSQK